MKLLASVHLTLDGVMGAPEEWAFDRIDEESGRLSADELSSAAALLMGRRTYEGFVTYWPSSTDPEAERMNGLPKYVASRSMTTAEWNATLLTGDVTEQVRELKERPGGDLLLLASADLAATLRAADLIDEYRLWVHPVAHGSGKRYFDSGGPTPLELTDTTRFGSGIVVLTYRRLGT